MSLHDVAPANDDEIIHIVKALRARVGNAISAAVIPAPFGRGCGAKLADFVLANCRELALHGYSHQGHRRCHPLAYLTSNSTEFLGLSPGEIRTRLERGQGILREVFGRTALVLIPPAWCSGALTPAIADTVGCHVLVSLTHLATRAMKFPLAVYSWDCGRFPALGYAGELFGHVRRHLPGGIPCVVLHPCDVSRNLFGRALAIIDRLLRNGFSPATFVEVADRMAESPWPPPPGEPSDIPQRHLCYHPGAQ